MRPASAAPGEAGAALETNRPPALEHSESRSSSPPPAGSGTEAGLWRVPLPPAAPAAASYDNDGDGCSSAEGGALVPPQRAAQPSLVVFSGGTAFNSVAGHVRTLTTRVAHVLPVSDDGGSTAEIVRVLGGPAVGDIRSRCLRLADDSDEEARAVRRLLAHRLSACSGAEAKAEWYSIVEGEHPLWESVSEPYKHTIRAFLVHFHVNILRHSTERFNYRSGSVGNFFFAGARTFFRSLEAAIFLFSRVARIPEGSLVLPAICTEQRITLGAELAGGTVLVGQNEISHPSASDTPSHVDKACELALPAPVRRIFYMSHEGDTHEHEVAPNPNPRRARRIAREGADAVQGRDVRGLAGGTACCRGRGVLAELGQADAIVYGMGSLYTSITPSLVLRGVGEAVAARDCPKIFLLNGAYDRETSSCQSHPGPMTASDMAVTDALNRRHSKKTSQLDHPPAAYVSAVLVPKGSPVEVDRAAMNTLGIPRVIVVPSLPAPGAAASPFGGGAPAVPTISGQASADADAASGSLSGSGSGSLDEGPGGGSAAAIGGGTVCTLGVHYDPDALVAAIRKFAPNLIFCHLCIATGGMTGVPDEGRAGLPGDACGAAPPLHCAVDGKAAMHPVGLGSDAEGAEAATLPPPASHGRPEVSQPQPDALQMQVTPVAAPAHGAAASAPAEPAAGAAGDQAPAGDTAPGPLAAAEPGATQLLHFTAYWKEEYEKEGEASPPGVCLLRWMLTDSNGRTHLAVDTTSFRLRRPGEGPPGGGEAGSWVYTFQAVQPFSVVRPLRADTEEAVDAYLLQFIPPSLLTHHYQQLELYKAEHGALKAQRAAAAAAAAPPAPAAAPGQAQPQEQPPQGKAGPAPVRSLAQRPPPQLAPGGALPMGVKRKPGRPRIHPPKEPTQPRQQRQKRQPSKREKAKAAVAAAAAAEAEAARVVAEAVMGACPAEAEAEAVASPASGPCAGALVSGKGNGAAAATAVAEGSAAAGGGGGALPSTQCRRQGQGLAGTSESEQRRQRHSAATASDQGRGKRNGLSEAKLAELRGACAAEAEAVAAAAAADRAVAELAARISSNSETHLQGEWLRAPLPGLPMERIASFELAPDCGEEEDASTLLAKLRCRLPPGACGAARGGGAAAGAPFGTAWGDVPRDLVVLPFLPPGLAESEVRVQAVWGLDAYTYRNVHAALALCPELAGAPGAPQAAAASGQQRQQFIQTWLLPSLNRLGPAGWDMSLALHLIRRQAQVAASQREQLGQLSPAAVEAAARSLERALEGAEAIHNGGQRRPPEERQLFRVHPKGEGVVCLRPEGLAEGAFVGEYVGELYCPWRWHEREHAAGLASKSKDAPKACRMGAWEEGEWYNVALERPAADARGYDVVLVNAAYCGNFTGRLAHSCTPNCCTSTTIVGSRLTVGVWTLRHVAPGEELTLDWECETDKEEEHTAATCLCGTAGCRGSYMRLARPQDGPLQQAGAQAWLSAVLGRQHSFLERCCLLLSAAKEPHLTFEDQERLSNNGFKDFLLTDGSPPMPVPGWLKKWAALVLEFIEGEAEQLLELLSSGGGYGLERAQDETANLRAMQVQQLACALDRAKLFLRHQARRRACVQHSAAPEALRGPPLRVLSEQEVVAFLWHGPNSIVRRVMHTMTAFARERRAAEASDGGGGRAKQQPDPDAHHRQMEAAVAAARVESAEDARRKLRQLAEALRAAGPTHAGLFDAVYLYSKTRVFVAVTEYQPFSAALTDGSEGGGYRPGYLWALLTHWFKDASDLPNVQLGLERMGCMCLPEIESCYSEDFSSGDYVYCGDRTDLLDHIAAHPTAPWPASVPFVCHSPSGVFGSPQLDAALGAQGADLQGVVSRLRYLFAKYETAAIATVPAEAGEVAVAGEAAEAGEAAAAGEAAEMQQDD
eukprot:scaffold3.g6601.t1